MHKSGGGAIYSSSLCGCSARRKGTVYRIGTAAGADGLGRQSGGCCSGTDGRRTLPYARRTLSQRGGCFAQAEYHSAPTAEGVEAAEVQIVPQNAVTASQKRAIEALLEGQLQLGPECIKWNSPSGEDVP